MGGCCNAPGLGFELGSGVLRGGRYVDEHWGWWVGGAMPGFGRFERDAWRERLVV